MGLEFTLTDTKNHLKFQRFSIHIWHILTPSQRARTRSNMRCPDLVTTLCDGNLKELKKYSFSWVQIFFHTSSCFIFSLGNNVISTLFFLSGCWPRAINLMFSAVGNSYPKGSPFWGRYIIVDNYLHVFKPLCFIKIFLFVYYIVYYKTLYSFK